MAKTMSDDGTSLKWVTGKGRSDGIEKRFDLKGLTQARKCVGTAALKRMRGATDKDNRRIWTYGKDL